MGRTGADKVVAVLDVGRQAELRMRLGDFVAYLGGPRRERVLSVTGLEFSDTRLVPVAPSSPSPSQHSQYSQSLLLPPSAASSKWSFQVLPSTPSSSFFLSVVPSPCWCCRCLPVPLSAPSLSQCSQCLPSYLLQPQRPPKSQILPLPSFSNHRDPKNPGSSPAMTPKIPYRAPLSIPHCIISLLGYPMPMGGSPAPDPCFWGAPGCRTWCRPHGSCGSSRGWRTCGRGSRRGSGRACRNSA